ncbi:MAG: hypothetical protein AUJ99_00425 [Caldisericum sp. CG2_30_36_11]|nr:MAG: hypothetical protein AUJ99_00425 [Caldisericum sp. CG2_30_36_11]
MKNKEEIFIKRVTVIFLIFILLFVSIFLRLVFLQVVKRESLISELNPQFDFGYKVVEGKRGEILDCNNVPLALDQVTFQLDVNPIKLNSRDKEKIVKNLAKIVGISQKEVDSILKATQYEMVSASLSLEQKKEIDELEISDGVTLTQTYKRNYPLSNLLAPVVGFVGVDNTGLSGIEYGFNSNLLGNKGRVFYNINTEKPMTPGEPSYKVDPINGNSVVLTLDSNIQFTVEKLLENTVRSKGAKGGLVIVIKPKTGEILALVNYTNPDVNETNSINPYFDRAVQWNYEPGSVIKPIIAAAALEEGSLQVDDEFYCPGHLEVGDRVLSCWQKHGEEKGLNEIMKDSCDVSFMKIGLKLGKDNLLKFFNSFGFGRPTGVELPGEESGILPDSSKVGDVELATMSFGQGIAVTPLQLISALSAIANGGIQMKPNIIKEIINSEGEIVYQSEPIVKQIVISQEVASKVMDAMKAVVSKDGVPQAMIDGYSVAGKTGTAQKLLPQGTYSSSKLVYSFFGVIPSDNPEVSVLVVVDETSTPTYSLNITAPLFKQIGLFLIKYLRIEP